MSGIRDALRKIYQTENSLQKHVILFMLVGFVSMFEYPLNEISSKENLTSNEWSFVLIGFLGCMLVLGYIFAYTLRFINNSYKAEKADLMPDFSVENFKALWKSAPLLLSWFGYGLIFCFVAIVNTILYYYAGANLPIIVLLLAFLFTILLLPTVFVNFAKNYEWKGLLGFHHPFVYFKKDCKKILIILAKFLPILILLHAGNTLCYVTNNVVSYMGIAVLSYIGIIYQLALYFCFAQIYKDHENLII